uniref:Egg-white cystatin n=1 Tax=Junco hyemalis TaxID=40217 RepID=A0A8C5JGP9_JUNHY
MAVNLPCSLAALCCLALWSFTGTSGGSHVTPPHSTIRPGFPVPVNTDSPEVRRAARFGVYRYNNSSNDLFLFKESQIKQAMVQIVRGLKYMLHVEIKRTVCEKRDHPSLDRCHFQREKILQQETNCLPPKHEALLADRLPTLHSPDTSSSTCRTWELCLYQMHPVSQPG